jgi:hypothetical protein
MKPASLAVLVLAFAVAVVWPLTSAIGAAASRTGSRWGAAPVSCGPDGATARTDGDDGDDGDDDDDGYAALPPGHPSLQLPPGHPPMSLDGLPPGHPPVGALPPGHPPVSSGHGPAAPLPSEAFGAPVLLSI